MSVLLEPIVWLLKTLVDIYVVVVIVQVAIKWLIAFGVLEIKNQYSQKLVDILEKATGFAYGKLREKLPTFAGIDFSPAVLILALLFLSRILYRLDVMLLSNF